MDVSRGDEGSTATAPASHAESPGWLKAAVQKINPFKSALQMPKNHPQVDSANPQETEKPLQAKQSPGMFSGIMQKVVPFMSSQPKEVPPLHSETATTSGNLADSKSEKQESVKALVLHSAEAPSQSAALDPLENEDGLFTWWDTVEGWDEWNEAKQEGAAEELVEQAADRVFMAARLFVRHFNERGASLQRRILELLAVADSADSFHKKTLTASVGGGMAGVAGSVTTITGLILAPFTAGTSLIVTAVGIGVATAGGLTSASANITDTVHSKTDRKKVENMIHEYQEEMKDIKECLEFLQEGMEILAEWDFDKYTESISKKYLNQNIKHVVKEGGRAGKALVINTESLISTVQALSLAGGAAKAAQVMSITTGVMSGLFLALDVFFLAKDSMELKKGAKTEFAAKIREVCKDLQDGLLELNRIKDELHKTMDGAEEEDDDDQKQELPNLRS
ncbi:apolipoprotein L4-like [Betta splendens]|uniref:Apolipoprotein L4-like n=1 Tax=Betta splendens TaxID=158456 RepID=A0A6P7LLZ2_BETSP|nr:apolipoprotein L4-like [Betta splendens]XP_040925611.1 apolipoprotein L4-like [Betta splendens]